MSPFDRVHMTSYRRSIVTMALSRAFLRYSMSKNVVTLKSGSEATLGHWKLYHSVDRVLVFFCNFIIIIIIIIKSLTNSAALNNSDALQAYVIQCCGTGVPSGVVQKLPSTVTKDSGRLVGCSKCLDRKQQSSCDRWLWLSVAHSVCRSGGSRPQVPTSSKLNHRLAKLSQIRGC